MVPREMEATTRDLPVKFPSETEVILEDVARTRAMTADERLRCLRGMVNAGALMMRISPKAAWLEEHSQEQERLAQKNIQDFLARHGY